MNKQGSTKYYLIARGQSCLYLALAAGIGISLVPSEIAGFFHVVGGLSRSCVCVCMYVCMYVHV